MELKKYLIETFQYNDFANKLVLKKMIVLPDQAESIKLFSHLINCQFKWLERIIIYPEVSKLDWWLPVYTIDEMEQAWKNSLDAWFHFLQNKSDEDLSSEIKWIGIGNSTYNAQLKDIPLQLNYHSIHHRAQIQSIIRSQGMEPDFVDYIGTKYRKLD